MIGYQYKEPVFVLLVLYIIEIKITDYIKAKMTSCKKQTKISKFGVDLFKNIKGMLAIDKWIGNDLWEHAIEK